MKKNNEIKITRKFKQLIQSNPHDIGEIQSMLETHIKLYDTTPNGYERARLFNYFVDENIKKAKQKDMDTADRIYCQDGCHYCCYLSVAITEDEGLSILKYCEEKDLFVDIDKLKEQAKVRSENNWNELTEGHRSCIFLNDSTNLCEIYEVRPNTCRNHLVLDTNKNCHPDCLEKVSCFMPTISIIIANAPLSIVKCLNLPNMLLELFKKNK